MRARRASLAAVFVVLLLGAAAALVNVIRPDNMKRILISVTFGIVLVMTACSESQFDLPSISEIDQQADVLNCAELGTWFGERIATATRSFIDQVLTDSSAAVRENIRHDLIGQMFPGNDLPWPTTASGANIDWPDLRDPPGLTLTTGDKKTFWALRDQLSPLLLRLVEFCD